MPFDHCDLCQVARGVCEGLAGTMARLVDERVGDDLARHDADHARAAAAPRHAEHLRAEGADPNGMAYPVGHFGLGDLRRRPSALQHGVGHERLEIGEDEEIGAVARGDRAEVLQAVPGRGAVRCADERVFGRDSERDGVAHHRVDVAVVRDVLRLAVVGAERDPPRPVFGKQRQKRLQVAGSRALADQEPHACAQPFAAFLDGVRLVVGADPGGGVRHQGATAHAGGVAVDVLRECELCELGRRAADDTGEVHHLGEPDHAPPAEQRREVARGQLAARRLELRRGHA